MRGGTAPSGASSSSKLNIGVPLDKSIFIGLFLLTISSCSAYKVQSKYSEVICASSTGDGKYNSLQECENSKEFSEAVSDFETKNSYIIVQKGNEDYGFNRYECRKKNTVPSDAEVIKDKAFALDFECEEYKKTLVSLWDRSIDKAKEKERVKKINKYFAANQKYSNFKQDALDRKIALKMPKEILILSWGKPTQTNITSGLFGTKEQLVYPNSNYVYVKEGNVESWQTSK